MADLEKESRIIKSLEAKGGDNLLVAGCDEAGRGAFAGPLVAAAVILPDDADLSEITDSKKISKNKHVEYSQRIMKEAIAIGIGVVDVEYIDRFGVGQANKKAIELAVQDLPHEPAHVLIDGASQQMITTHIPQTQIIQGDRKSLSIASASIIAKTVHDLMMKELDNKHPEYKWKNNTGYGTKAHMDAIYAFGLTEHHRKSFKPIRRYLKEQEGGA